MTPTQTQSSSTESISAGLMFAIAASAVLVWVVLYRIKKQHLPSQILWMFIAVRALTGVVSLWLTCQALQRIVTLGTPWPLWTLSAAGAAGVEAVYWLYNLERKIVRTNTGRTLLALRVALLLTLLGVLAQPLWSWKSTESVRRSVAVLVDNSASMQVAQSHLPIAEKLRLAEQMHLVKRPYHLDVTGTQLGLLMAELQDTQEFLARLRPLSKDKQGRHILQRSKSISSLLSRIALQGNSTLGVLATRPDKGFQFSEQQPANIAQTMTRLREVLDKQILSQVQTALNVLKSTDYQDLGRDYPLIADSITQICRELPAVISELSSLGNTLDEAFYRNLSSATHKDIDKLCNKTRFEYTWDVLLRREKAKNSSAFMSSLLERLVADYDVNMAVFSADTNELSTRQWSQAASDRTKAPVPPSDLPETKQKTDLTQAIQHVAALAGRTDLAGAIILSDMRHNASSSPVSTARILQDCKVPLFPIVMGSATPPRDAGIVSVDAPESILPQDSLFASARIRLAALAGQNVRIRLLHDSKVVDETTVHVEDNTTIDQTVQFSHQPNREGTHGYLVRIEPIEGEILSTNNEYSFSVNVNDNKTQLLIIEQRPRWEFRYLKNLFAGRDESVRLQYILVQPDRVEGQGTPPIIPASASRPADHIRATVLPQSPEEWMKFDVIILGDISPRMLGFRAMEAIDAFVTERGGTLVCIAGPNYMPHAYNPTILPELLPVTFDSSRQSAIMPEKSYRIALTGIGKNHPITRQSPNKQENLSIWDSQPPLYWRHAGITAKPSATILAYAREDDYTYPQAADEQTALRLHQKYQQSRPLIAVQDIGVGKVVFLGHDRTWRMRYRVGDTHHHKFWGQVLRWATQNRLPDGTPLVKVGTDRARYHPHETVRMQARVLQPDYSPLVSDQVGVNIYQDKKLIMHKELQLAGDERGVYQAKLPPLPGGAYRAEVVGPEVTKILETEGKASSVSTLFSVDVSIPQEQLELSADFKMAKRLAEKTGGTWHPASQAEKLLEALSRNPNTQTQEFHWTLWDSWPMLLALLTLASLEWLIRKRAGLV